MPLTDRQLDDLIEPLEALYERFYQSVLEDMARRLSRIGMSEATAFQADRLREAGLLQDEILTRLSKLTGATKTELKRAFRKYGVKFTAKDREIYQKAGYNPLDLSPAQLNALEAGLRKTGNVIENLTMTTAVTTQQSFIDAADLAYMQVSTGAMTYQQAIREAVLSCTRKGLTVISFASGRNDQLDVAMRRTILTGVAQTTGNMQLELAREMGCDLVEVDAHFGARNHGTGPMNHESWQGKIYSISGTDHRYPPLIETTGYGTVIGLYGVNCRHSCYPYIEGVSEPSYSNGELREMAEKRVTYNGEELTYYDATQKQREIERAIRKAKREAGALEAAGLDNTAERMRLGHYQEKMRDFINQTGLGRDRFRESVPGVNVRALTRKTANALPPRSVQTPQPAPVSTNASSSPTSGFNLIQGSHTSLEDLKATNPNYSTQAVEWTYNCQRCVTAYEARRRGLDVVAMPAKVLNGKPDPSDMFQYLNGSDGLLSPYDNPIIEIPGGRTKAKTFENIRNLMAGHGDGARAIVIVHWQKRGGHAFIAEQHGSQTIFIDPQTANNNVVYYFTGIRPAETRLIRIDNLAFTDMIKEAVMNK